MGLFKASALKHDGTISNRVTISWSRSFQTNLKLAIKQLSSIVPASSGTSSGSSSESSSYSSDAAFNYLAIEDLK